MFMMLRLNKRLFTMDFTGKKLYKAPVSEVLEVMGDEIVCTSDQNATGDGFEWE